MEEIKKLDIKDSLFFNHQAPFMVEWFDNIVKERREKEDYREARKGWEIMNKKVMIGIVAIIVIAIVGFVGYFLFSNQDKKNKNEKTPSNNTDVNENTGINNDNQDNETMKDDTTSTLNGKTLVVYYSASGSTKKVAERIAKNLNADLFEIVPENIYTSEDLNWTNENSRVSREHNDESLRNVKLKTTNVDNWESYDTVLIGYPIWWGTTFYV